MKHLMENLLLLARGDDSELKKDEELFKINDFVLEIVKEFELMKKIRISKLKHKLIFIFMEIKVYLNNY